MAHDRRFLLEVPLDASRVSNFDPAYQVKVVAYPVYGEAYERVVNFSPDGRGSALFTFSETPGCLKVAIWPKTVFAAGLRNLQTIQVDVPGSMWRTASEILLPDVAISDYYWNWWLHLTRKFSAGGRPAGTSAPVFASSVCVYDGDGLW